MALLEVAVVLVRLELYFALLAVNLGLDLLVRFFPADAHIVGILILRVFDVCKVGVIPN